MGLDLDIWLIIALKMLVHCLLQSWKDNDMVLYWTSTKNGQNTAIKGPLRHQHPLVPIIAKPLKRMLLDALNRAALQPDCRGLFGRWVKTVCNFD